MFSDFNDEVLRQRIKEGKILCSLSFVTSLSNWTLKSTHVCAVRAKAVITADIRVIGGKTKNLKEKIARALSNGATSVQFVLVVKRSDTLSGKVGKCNLYNIKQFVGICISRLLRIVHHPVTLEIRKGSFCQWKKYAFCIV